MKKDTARDRKR